MLQVMYSSDSYVNFIDKLIEKDKEKDPEGWFSEYYDGKIGYYYGAGIVKSSFDNWINNGMKD